MKKFGFVGVTPEPDDGWGAARKRPGRGRDGEEKGPSERDGAGASARSPGVCRGGGDVREEAGTEGAEDRRESGVSAGNGGSAGRRLRQREVVDLWWLTGK